MSVAGAGQQERLEYVSRDKQVRWGVLRKAGFRFLFCYVLLFGIFCLNFTVEGIIFDLFTGRFPTSALDRFWGAVVPLVARYIFRLQDFKFQAITSGDSLSDYLQFTTYVLISLLAALVWSMIDRKRTNYSKLNHWLRLYAQFVLAITIAAYGFDKLIPMQFGELTPSRLVGTVGDLTPFTMLWTFMASSKPYTIFSGALEVLSGVLLVTPKLRSLGALLAMAVMTNVFALNVFYDVPVKSFSLQLLLLAIYLASPEFPRLINVLVLNRTVEPRSTAPLGNNQRVVKWPPLIQGGLAACFFVLTLIANVHHYAMLQASTQNVPFGGIWEIDQFTVTGSPLRPLFTSKIAAQANLQPGHDHWTKLIIERAGSAVIQLETGDFDGVQVAINKDRDQLDISDSYDPTWKAHFAMQQPAADVLNLKGTVNDVPVEIKLHADKKAFPLTSGEYHIIYKY